VERAAPADLALEPDPTRHALDQAPGDREPQSGSTEPPCGRGIRLSEGVEDEPAFVVGNADACVLHGDIQRHRLRRDRFGVDTHRDLAPLGELDRVADQIEDDLADSPGVADQIVRDIGPDLVHELEPLGVGERRERLEHLAERLAQAEGHGLQLEPAGLDLGEVEDVVDDRQERLA
jgi:hypothetical protein